MLCLFITQFVSVYHSSMVGSSVAVQCKVKTVDNALLLQWRKWFTVIAFAEKQTERAMTADLIENIDLLF